MRFYIEPFYKIAAEIYPLIPSIYEGMNETYDAPDVDWEYYMELDEQCVAVHARVEKEIVALAVFQIGNNPNHKTIREATNALIYVKPEYRGRLGGQLIDESRRHLMDMGVKEITFLLKDKKIGNLLARKGYQPEFTAWSIKT